MLGMLGMLHRDVTSRLCRHISLFLHYLIPQRAERQHCRTARIGRKQDIHTVHTAENKTFGADRLRSELYGMSRTALFPAEIYEHIKLFTIITANLQCQNATEMVGYCSERTESFRISQKRRKRRKAAERRRKAF